MEFEIKGIKIRFSFLFFFFFSLMFLLDQSGFVLMGFLAALIHELGHVIAFVLVLDFPSEISFEISGIKMVRSKKITSYKKEVFQLLMGSFFNFILFFILFFSLNSINRISIFAVSHLILGIFNLLPIQALDGGKLLRLFWEKKTDIQTAYRITNIISWSTLLGLAVVSVIFFLHQKSGNLSFLLICIWMFSISLKKTV